MIAKKTRCAIYTRKSSEEGLEQGFNSLHAQREACEAYVLSQAGEGWSALKRAYDDGGFSGGSMERPGLEKLLADIGRGLIDVVVVYKVDRLTRSLTDFARIVEAFDAQGVSFVSVTQAFNTTTSMGRLTLNVLLSFAQFEREVTGERIRDKIAASKKKGMWMGGVPPLGYDLPTDQQTRALVVNEDQATTVRLIFAKYLELGSVHDLKAWLADGKFLSKAWVSAKGNKVGGLPFNRGALFHLLKNRVYLGEITHKGQAYLGAHGAIVDAETFAAVQEKLASQAHRHRGRPKRVSTMALRGLIFDADGEPMSPTFTHKSSGRVYRYYVSSPLQTGTRRNLRDGVIRRVPASAIEDLVAGCLARLGGASFHSVPDARNHSVASLLARIEVHPTTVQLVIRPAAFFSQASDPQSQIEILAARLAPSERITPAEPSLARPACNTPADRREDLARVTLPAKLKRHGGRVRITDEAGRESSCKNNLDAALVCGLRGAHAFLSGCNTPPPSRPEHLAIPTAPKSPYHRRLCRLAFLAPDIQRLILEGRQPADLRVARFLHQDLPAAWEDQRRMFGIPC